MAIIAEEPEATSCPDQPPEAAALALADQNTMGALVQLIDMLEHKWVVYAASSS